MSDAHDPQAEAKAVLAPFVSSIGASTAAAQYAVAVVVIAAAERGAIDPARVFQLLGVLADGFDLSPHVETTRMVATTLRGVQTIYETLTKIPSGAGHA